MKTRSGLAMALILGTGLSGCAGTGDAQLNSPGKSSLAAHEIEQTLKGNTLVMWGRDSIDRRGWVTYFAPDGTARGKAYWPGGTATDRGVWKARHQEVCLEWRKWEGGERNCYRIHVTKEDKVFFTTPDGRVYNGPDPRITAGSGSLRVGDVEPGNNRKL